MAVHHEESRQSCIRGFHIYQDVWLPVIGEELHCHRETANMVDRYAVAVTKNDQIVGHLPKKISKLASLFIRRGGNIVCKVTGRRRRSLDLIQGGLEVPCQLYFVSEEAKEISKIIKLLDSMTKQPLAS